MRDVEIVAAVLVGILSVARTARLVIHDDFPPMMWLRLRWFVWVGESKWGELLKCQFCLTPYMAIVMASWFWGSDGHWTWWVINGVWGLSYLSAILVSYDQPPD